MGKKKNNNTLQNTHQMTDDWDFGVSGVSKNRAALSTGPDVTFTLSPARLPPARAAARETRESASRREILSASRHRDFVTSSADCGGLEKNTILSNDRSRISVEKIFHLSANGVNDKYSRFRCETFSFVSSGYAPRFADSPLARPGVLEMSRSIAYCWIRRFGAASPRIWLREYASSGAKGQNEEARRREIMSRGLPKQKPIRGVKRIVLVASGKGGVGKSTTSANLATALKITEPTKDVGLLDADIFGPTIPLMMNLHQSPLLNDDDLMEPLVNYDVKCMSMGFLIDEKSPVVWRGLMVMSALDRLLRQVAWGPLDYLVVDTPPGTGDTLLSLAQNLPIDGAIIVTTPQRASLEVARRGAKMFQTLRVPIAGIVENMTSVECPKCGHEVSLFGDGADSLAQELDTRVLMKFSMREEIAESSDKGKPIVVSAPKSLHAESYRRLAKDVVEFLEKQPKRSE